MIRECRSSRGAADFISGGSLPVDGGIVIALNRLNRILSIDPDIRTAVVEPGVINLHLTEAAARFGLTTLRSVQPGGVHDRRKPGVQFRRRALPEARHDQQPRAWH